MVYNCRLETQLKQRLTGAVILVALVVIIVPEFLSGPPSDAPVEGSTTASSDYQTVPAQPSNSAAPPSVADNPMQGAAMRTYTIELANNEVPAESSSAVASAAAPDEPSAPTAGATSVATADANNRDRASAAVDEPPLSTSRPAGASRAPQPTAGQSAGGYAVQIGSFGNRDNAERLVGSLRAKGFAAYMDQSSGSRKLYRVRVGPVTERAAADALAGQLAKAGQKGVVVPNS